MSDVVLKIVHEQDMEYWSQISQLIRMQVINKHLIKYSQTGLPLQVWERVEPGRTWFEYAGKYSTE